MKQPTRWPLPEPKILDKTELRSNRHIKDRALKGLFWALTTVTVTGGPVTVTVTSAGHPPPEATTWFP